MEQKGQILMRRTTATVMQMALFGTMFCANGCIIGFKPASETILTISPAAPGSHTDTVAFGMADVYWDQLHHGYGVAGESYHSRDHEAYFFWGFYDPYRGSENRMIVITPLCSAAEDGMTYKLEMRIVSSRLSVGQREWRCAVAIGPPVCNGDTIRFDLKDVPVNGPWPERMVLSGRVVAHKTSLDNFEDLLSRWNEQSRWEAER